MTSQVVSMQDAWKREQNLVIQLEKDLQFKEDQLQRALDATAFQKEKNEMVLQELDGYKNKMSKMTPRNKVS